MARLGELGLPFGMGLGIVLALEWRTHPVPQHLMQVDIILCCDPLPCLRALLFAWPLARELETPETTLPVP